MISDILILASMAIQPQWLEMNIFLIFFNFSMGECKQTLPTEIWVFNCLVSAYLKEISLIYDIREVP